MLGRPDKRFSKSAINRWFWATRALMPRFDRVEELGAPNSLTAVHGLQAGEQHACSLSVRVVGFRPQFIAEKPFFEPGFEPEAKDD